MDNPTYSSDDLRAIADMIDGFTAVLMKDDEYVVPDAEAYEISYAGGIPVYLAQSRIGQIIFEDGWMGFQHD